MAFEMVLDAQFYKWQNITSISRPIILNKNNKSYLFLLSASLTLTWRTLVTCRNLQRTSPFLIWQNKWTWQWKQQTRKADFEGKCRVLRLQLPFSMTLENLETHQCLSFRTFHQFRNLIKAVADFVYGLMNNKTWRNILSTNNWH